MESTGQSATDTRSIKQVANLYGCTIATLHYYEEIGLFKASRNEENGYRVYRGEDFAHLNLIKTLRDMDIPLSEVKRYEASHTLETNIDILQRELERIESLMGELRDSRNAVQSALLRYTRALIDAPSEEIKLLDLPARPCVMVTEELGDEHNVPLLCAERIHAADMSLNVFGMLPTFTLKTEVNAMGAFSATKLMLYSEAPTGAEDSTIPSGLYLSVSFGGPLQRTPEMYGRIVQQIEAEGLAPCGDPYEFWTINEYSSYNPNEFVRTLQQRVVKS